MLLCFTSLLTMMVLPVRAIDLPVLEALIQTHKSVSDRLKSRIAVNVSSHQMTNLGKQDTESFGKILQVLSHRSSGGAAQAALVAELGTVATLTNQVISYEKKTVDAALNLYFQSPVMANKGLELHQEFAEMITRISRQSVYLVSSGLGVTLATQEQCHHFIRFVVTELKAMRDKFRAFNKFVSAASQVRVSVSRGYEVFKNRRQALVRIWDDTFHAIQRRGRQSIR